MKTMKIIMSVIFVLSLLACNGYKMSTIKENSCNFPCWNGIVPGETNYSDTLKNLKMLTWVDSFDGNSTQLDVKINGAKETSAQVLFSNDKINSIQILSSEWRLAEVFDLLGEPDSYLSYYEMYDRTNSQVLLYYPKESMIVMINNVKFTPGTKENTVSLNSEILGFSLFPQNSTFSQYLQTIGISSRFVSSNLHNWEGVGELATERYMSE